MVASKKFIKSDIITIDCNISDPKGKIWSGGITAKMHIEISDGLAVFRSEPPFVCKRLAYAEIGLCREKGVDCSTAWNDRFQKSITAYVGKSKEEIKEIIVNQLNMFGGKLS